MRPSTSTVLRTSISSASSVYNSTTVYGWDIVRCSYQATVGSGSLSGTFKLQASNDLPVGLPPNQFTPTNWNDIASSSVVVASSTASIRSFITPIQEVCYSYYRVVFTDASSGTLSSVTVRFNAFSL